MPWILDPYHIGARYYSQQKVAVGTYAALKAGQRMFNSNRYQAGLKKSWAMVGLKPPGSSKSAPYQAQIDALRRRVAQNTAAKSFFTSTQTFSSATGVAGVTYNLTSLFTASGQFRDYVTGDKYINNWLRLNFLVQQNISAFRFVVYTPKKTTTDFLPSPTTTSDLTIVPDPAAFTVWHDEYINPPDTFNSDCGIRRTINLRRLMTIYNESSSVLERGEVKLWVGVAKSSGFSVAFDVGTMLALQDK